MRSTRLLANAVVALALAAPAAAQIVLVPNVASDGEDPNPRDGVCDVDPAQPGNQCTLRAAIQTANALGGDVEILLGAWIHPLSIGGTDDGSRWGDLDVAGTALQSLSIRGVPGTVIDAGPLQAAGTPDRVLHVTAAVSPNLRVELRDLELRGGRAGGAPGGGIRHQAGELILVNVGIQDCQGTDGGGLRVDAAFSMSGGSVANCVSSAVGSGGGAHVATPGSTTVLFAGVLFQSNAAGQKGGGLRTASGSFVTVRDGTFRANGASAGGGASWRGSGLVERTTFEQNSAATGGGLSVDLGGTLTLAQSALRANAADQGAGLHTAALTSSTLLEVTVDGNVAALNGGGVSNSGALTIGRSTISRNTAGSAGGGLHTFGLLQLTLSTVSGNRVTGGSGGGLYVLGTQSTEISACTLAFNSATVDGAGIQSDDVFGPPVLGLKSTVLDQNAIAPFGFSKNFGGVPVPTTHGYNVDADGTCGTIDPTDQRGSMALPLSAQLGPLQGNGGPTETHELAACSPAVDRGSDLTIAGLVLPFDQRTLPHVGPPDAGAFERQTPPPPPFDAFCFGTAAACPCGAGGASCGCPNSVSPGGGCLTATGTPSIASSTAVLHGAGMPNSTALYFQGTTRLNGGLGVPFGDGLRCAGGPVIRLGVRTNAGGASSWPPAGGSIPAQGQILTPGTRTYQVWYRNADPAFCTSATFNLTNGLEILWCP